MEKLTQILHELQDGKISADNAEEQVLRLFAVMPSLLASGKLALAARLVTTANAKNLSQRIEQMEGDLDAYDNEILSLRNKA